MKTLQYPFNETILKSLQIGEEVVVNGRLYTGRDRVHKYIAQGGLIHVDIKNSAIFHCGPLVVKNGDKWNVLALGPTTSLRHESYMPIIIEKYKIKLILGKGGMGEITRNACRQYGCVYLQLPGGAAAFLAEKVKKVNGVYFLKEFGTTEAMWDFMVEDLHAIVAIDYRGRSIFKKVQISSHKKLKQLISE